MTIKKFLGITIPLSSSIFVAYYMARFFIDPSVSFVIYERSRIISGAEFLTLAYGIVYSINLIWKD